MTATNSRTTHLTIVILFVLHSFCVAAQVAQEPCGGPCRCSSDRTLQDCSGSGLVRLPSIHPSTTHLNLDNNHINLIRNDSFIYQNLQILSISENGLRRLEPGVFNSLRELRELSLARNQLINLPADLFIRNRHLQVIDLSSNFFSSIPDHLMTPLHSLQVLNISFNRLTSAKFGSGFRYTTILQNIDLSGNNIPAIEENSFGIMSHWDRSLPRHLNLSYCNIWHISADAFSDIPSLRTLSLKGNQHILLSTLGASLEYLPSDSLEDANFSHLNITDILDFVSHIKTNSIKSLQMSHNNIERIPKRTFFFLVNLRHLDLSHNIITTIENLAGLSKVEYLNLAYNNLANLDEMMFEGLSDLKFLDISHNSLTQLSDEPFLNLFHLNTIDLSCNEITGVSLTGGLESLEVLRLDQNRLADVSFLKRLRRLHTIDVSRNIITRLSQQIFSRQQNIRLANFSGNAIFNITRDAFLLADYIKIDLSRNRMTNLENYGWESVQIIHLDGNSIYNIAADSFIRTENLRELYLQNNNLFSIPNGLLANSNQLKVLDLGNNPLGTFIELSDRSSFLDDLSQLEVLRLRKSGFRQLHDRLLSKSFSLRELDLSYNQLSSLTPTFLRSSTKLRLLSIAYNQLQSFDINILEGLPQLKQFDISGNPFQCTCEVVSLCQKLYSGTINITGLHNRTLYQCATPGEWRGVPLAVFYSDAGGLCRGYDTVIVAAAVACGAVVLLVILGIAACRYRAWKRHKPRPVRKGPMIVNYKFVDERTLTTSSSSSTGSSRGDCSNSGRGVPPRRELSLVPEYNRQLLEPSRCYKIRE